jgi:branched-chain amino acid transport system substrate-binding protein
MMSFGRRGFLATCVGLMAAAQVAAAVAADIRIGLLLSQSGPLSSYGVPMKAAAEHAAQVINDAGGINGNKLVVLVEDDSSNPTNLLNGLNRLIDSERAMALVGPITTGFYQAGAPIVKEKGVVMISPTATAPNLTTGNPFAFRNNPSEDVNIPVLLKEIRGKLPAARSMAIIYDNKQAADKIIGTLYESLAPGQGWEVQGVTTFLSGQLNYSDVVARTLKGKPDLVAAAAHAEDAANVARELRRQGYRGPILGGTPTVSQDYIKIGGDAVADTYVVVPYYYGVKTSENATFVASYGKATHRTTPDPWEASTYECIGMIAQAMRDAKVTGDPAKLAEERKAVQEKLAALKAYPGLIGPISFDADRVAVKPAVIIRVRNGAWEAL